MRTYIHPKFWFHGVFIVSVSTLYLHYFPCVYIFTFIPSRVILSSTHPDSKVSLVRGTEMNWKKPLICKVARTKCYLYFCVEDIILHNTHINRFVCCQKLMETCPLKFNRNDFIFSSLAFLFHTLSHVYVVHSFYPYSFLIPFICSCYLLHYGRTTVENGNTDINWLLLQYYTECKKQNFRVNDNFLYS